jgi:hypothetical protein
MPWDHCDVEFVLDDEACPKCGVTKDAWTVQVEKTRHLVIGRKPPRARWSRTRAREGEVVELIVDRPGLPEGAAATFRIFEHDAPGSDGKPAHDAVDEVEGAVSSGVLRAAWTCVWVEDDDDWATRYDVEGWGLEMPEMFFEVDLPEGRVASGHGQDQLLVVTGTIDERVLDADGQPLVGVPWVALLSDGTRREGVTDQDGRVHLEDVAPGRYELQLDHGPPPAPPFALFS